MCRVCWIQAEAPAVYFRLPYGNQRQHAVSCMTRARDEVKEEQAAHRGVMARRLMTPTSATHVRRGTGRKCEVEKYRLRLYMRRSIRMRTDDLVDADQDQSLSRRGETSCAFPNARYSLEQPVSPS